MFFKGGEYEGCIDKKRMPHGHGTLCTPNRSAKRTISICHYFHGVKSGFGYEAFEITSKAPHYYVGFFRDDKRSGIGVRCLGDPCHIVGYWRGDVLHGVGHTLREKEGYCGQYSEGKRHGVGQLTQIEEQTFYMGQFRNDMMHGIVAFDDSEKSYRSIGHYHNGEKHGLFFETIGGIVIRTSRWDHGKCIFEESGWLTFIVLIFWFIMKYHFELTFLDHQKWVSAFFELFGMTDIGSIYESFTISLVPFFEEKYYHISL
jgi:hypothetical protein